MDRAILMHVFASDTDPLERQMHRAELRNLSETAGAEVLSEMQQTVEKERPESFIGKGKLGDLAELAHELGANLIVFSVDLSGSQVRNIEEACGVRVIDRTQLILDIFASRAASFEGKSQVKLAQLSYLLPRLVGSRKEMSRLGGGIGTRGPGETKLEIDRRTIRREIADLRRLVQAEGERRLELRKRRKRQGVYSVGIVGYTNAGKTTLLSQLAKRFGDKTLAIGRNRLFDTLDLASRRIRYLGRTFVFTDTVGFIRELPHHLVDAFRATLEEAVDADVIVHVVDAESPHLASEMHIVHDVLQHSLRVNCPVITLFNRKGSAAETAILVDQRSTETVWGSVLDEETLQALLERIDKTIGRKVSMHLMIPHDRSDLVADAYRVGRVDRLEERVDGLSIDVEVDAQEANHFVPFMDHSEGDEEYI